MNSFARWVLVVLPFVPTSGVGQVCAKQISVPEYAPIARAARMTGSVILKITVGPQGQPSDVEGSGPFRLLVDTAKENARNWIFCTPADKRTAQVRLKYDYRLQGAPDYKTPIAKVIIDLGEGTVTITSAPPELEE